MRLGSASLAVALLGITIPVTAGVTVEVGRGVDLSQYSTWSWERGTASGDDRVRKLIEQAVESELSKTGLTRVDGDADLIVSTVTLAESLTGTTADAGYWGGGSDFGVPTVTTADFRKGTLQIRVKERSTGELVWQASGSAKMQVGQGANFNRKINSLVQKILKKFPR